MDRVLERAQHITLWVISFGQETLSLGDLEAKVVKLGRRTHSIAVKYSRLAALAKEAKRESDREHLVIGWDDEAVGRIRTEAGMPAILPAETATDATVEVR